MRGLRPGLSCYASSHSCAVSRPFGLQSLSPAHLARQALRAPLALRPVGLRGGLLATLPPLRVLGVLITLRLAAISPPTLRWAYAVKGLSRHMLTPSGRSAIPRSP